MTMSRTTRDGVEVAQVLDLRFCHVHGYAHYDGEMDRAPEGEPYCKEEDWEVVALDPDEFRVESEEKEQPRETGVYTLSVGDLAYIYTVRGGLVPCKVMSVGPAPDYETVIQVTAPRLGWKRGETEIIRNPLVSLLHRKQVRTRRGRHRIIGALRMMSDEEFLNS